MSPNDRCRLCDCPRMEHDADLYTNDLLCPVTRQTADPILDFPAPAKPETGLAGQDKPNRLEWECNYCRRLLADHKATPDAGVYRCSDGVDGYSVLFPKAFTHVPPQPPNPVARPSEPAGGDDPKCGRCLSRKSEHKKHPSGTFICPMDDAPVVPEAFTGPVHYPWGTVSREEAEPAPVCTCDSVSRVHAVDCPVAVKAADSGGHPGYLALLDEMRALHLKKAADYGRGSDPLANCRASADFGVPAYVGVLIRVGDKIHRIKSFLQNGTLANESFRDSLIDGAAYLLIAVALFDEEQEEKQLQALMDAKPGDPGVLNRPLRPMPTGDASLIR